MVRGAGGFWWVHNDSGDGPYLYAVADSGKLLAKVTVTGATNVDWEDLAAGPCPDDRGRCLYIGDIGNNRLTRKDLKIYVIREPEPTTREVNVLTVLPVRFPQKPANSEALIYDPKSRLLLIVTKEFSGRSRVLSRSLDPGEPLLRPVAEFDLSNRELGDNLVTGAALDSTATAFLLRTYGTAFLWKRTPLESWNHLFHRTPQAIPLASEPQGEAIAFGAGEQEFYTLSEEKPVLLFYSCAP